MKQLPQADSGLAEYDLMAAQLSALLEDERDFIANAAQFSSFIFHELENLNWAGFYLNQNEELVLGPFQGKIACVRIPFSRGVCGQSARTRATVRVDDVHAHPDHIACDSASNAEIVMPVIHNGRLIGVFDIDSPQLQRFTEADQVALERLLAIFVAATDFPA